MLRKQPQSKIWAENTTFVEIALKKIKRPEGSIADFARRPILRALWGGLSRCGTESLRVEHSGSVPKSCDS